MSRDGLASLVCVVLALGLTSVGFSAPPEDGDNKLQTMLAVQQAMQQGRDQLQRGNFQAAVRSLESQVSRIDGNREYLDLLRKAYRGYVRELQQNNRTAELSIYQRRLEILEPIPGGTGTSAGIKSPVRSADDDGPHTPSLAQLAQAPDPRQRRIEARGVASEAIREPGDLLRGALADGKALLRDAEVEYSNGRYDAALRLFEQVNRCDPNLVTTAQERWAYCKVFSVADLLNRSAVTNDNAGQIEQDVRRAMSMSPKLDDFGKKLLREIQSRLAGGTTVDTTHIEVRHPASKARGGWALAETDNFHVWYHGAPELADRVARIAEATRTSAIRKWFDDDDRPWDRPCDIYLHPTGQDYALATGKPAGSPGHSTITRERMSDRILARRIDLHCDNDNMTVGVLPHETTHCVIAGRFGPHDIPRWADEGMAVLSEPRDRIDMHLRNLPRHSQERQLFGVGQLMRLDDYPDPRLIGPFYAQSVSVVEFLSQEKGPRVFSQFLREALQRNSYELALEKYYGVQRFYELESRWQRYAFGSNAAVAGRNP